MITETQADTSRDMETPLVKVSIIGANIIHMHASRSPEAEQMNLEDMYDEEKVAATFKELARLRPYLSARDCAFFAAYFSHEVTRWEREAASTDGSAMVREFKAMARKALP